MLPGMGTGTLAPGAVPAAANADAPDGSATKRVRAIESSDAEGRAAGSMARHQRTMASRAGGVSARTSVGDGTLPLRRATATAAGESPEKGRWPVSSSYITRPSE